MSVLINEIDIEFDIKAEKERREQEMSLLKNYIRNLIDMKIVDKHILKENSLYLHQFYDNKNEKPNLDQGHLHYYRHVIRVEKDLDPHNAFYNMKILVKVLFYEGKLGNKVNWFGMSSTKVMEY